MKKYTKKRKNKGKNNKGQNTAPTIPDSGTSSPIIPSKIGAKDCQELEEITEKTVNYISDIIIPLLTSPNLLEELGLEPHCLGENLKKIQDFTESQKIPLFSIISVIVK